MKIAVASERGMVAEHFGHCESFMVFDVADNQVVNSETIANPGHKPGFLPNFLNDLGVKVIVAGGMGAGAIEIFKAKEIQVITGACGKAQDVVNQYLAGALKSCGSVCNQHQHHGECGE